MSFHRNSVLLRRLQRLPMTAALRTLGGWPESSQQRSEGLTIVIACMQRLLPLAIANVALLQRSEAACIGEIVLVFDCSRAQLGERTIEQLCSMGKRFPVRVECYAPYEAAVLKVIEWGWCYAWRSWTHGLACSRTRHVLLQDLDALVLDPYFIQMRYDAATRSGSVFHGVGWYSGLGVTAEMKICVTYEVVMDADAVQQRFSRIDVFNHLTKLNGKLVEFDTFLWVQHRLSSSSISEIADEALLHPSQLICNHTDLLNGRSIISKRQHSLALLPYYVYLADDSADAIAEFGDQLSRGTPRISGRDIPVGHITASHWTWMEKQCRRCEVALFGRPRVAVEPYLRGLSDRAAAAALAGLP